MRRTRCCRQGRACTGESTDAVERVPAMRSVKRCSLWFWFSRSLLPFKFDRFLCDSQPGRAQETSLAQVERGGCRATPWNDFFVSRKRFSSHVFAGVCSSWHNLLSGSEHIVSAHYDFSVSSGWKTSAPNLPNGQLSLQKVAQGTLRVARRFPKSLSSLNYKFSSGSISRQFQCSPCFPSAHFPSQTLCRYSPCLPLP